MKLYLDSNVFISLIKEELDKNLRPLYLEAEEFFSYVSTKQIILVLSELFFEEVYKISNFKKERVIQYFKKIDVPVLIIEKNQMGGEVKGIHYPDSKHAATAIKFGCKYIITFNTKDFENLREIDSITPNEF